MEQCLAGCGVDHVLFGKADGFDFSTLAAKLVSKTGLVSNSLPMNEPGETALQRQHTHFYMPRKSRQRLRIAHIAIFLFILFSYIFFEAANLCGYAFINRQPSPQNFTNVIGRLTPNLQAMAFWNPELKYEYSTDQDGFRNNGQQTQEAQKTLLCIGDSYTFGMGVSDDKTFPSILEQTLNISKHHGIYRVINAGAMDTGIIEHLDYYKQFPKKHICTLVVLQLNIYDLKSIRQHLENVPNNHTPEKYFWLNHNMLFNAINNNVTLYSHQIAPLRFFLTRTTYDQISRKNNIIPKTTSIIPKNIQQILGNRKKILNEENLKKTRFIWDAYCDALLEFKQYVEKNGADLLLLIVPDPEQIHDYLNAPSEAIIPFCIKHDIKFLDVTRDFRNLYINHGINPFLEPYDLHCSVQGNELIADEILNRIDFTSKNLSFTSSNYPYVNAEPSEVEIDFDPSGKILIPDNPYFELLDYEKRFVTIKKEAGGSLTYITADRDQSLDASSELTLRIKKPVAQLSLVVFPHVNSGTINNGYFAITMGDVQSEAFFTTKNSNSAEYWKGFETPIFLEYVMPKDAPPELRIRFSFKGDAGFILENKHASGPRRRFSIIAYPRREPRSTQR